LAETLLQGLLVVLFLGQFEIPLASSISAFSFSHSSTPDRRAVLSLRIFCAPSLSFQVGLEGFLLDLGEAGDLGV
jgi:hypothetical protein